MYNITVNSENLNFKSKSNFMQTWRVLQGHSQFSSMLTYLAMPFKNCNHVYAYSVVILISFE